MKFFFTVTFLLSLASVAFAREEAILARVTSYWAGEGSNYASTGSVCAPDIARSIRNEFRTGVKLFSLMASAPRSTPERQWLIAKPLVDVDERRANSRPSWSIDFLKKNEGRSGRVDKRTFGVHDPSNCSARISPRPERAVADNAVSPSTISFSPHEVNLLK